MSNADTPKLLAVTGDPQVIRRITESAGAWYTITPCRFPQQAMQLLARDRSIRLLVTEHNSAHANFLDEVRDIRPDVLRVMLTAYSDLGSIVSGLHSGAIQRLVQKPIVMEELRATIDPASLLPTAPNALSA